MTLRTKETGHEAVREAIEVSRSKNVLTFFNKFTLKDTVERFSKEFPCHAFRKFQLYLFIDSTGAPTDIHIKVQFLNPNDGQWYYYKQGLFASLYWEDTDTASGIRECFSGDCVGRAMRISVTGGDASSAAYWTVTSDVEFLN